MAPEPKRAHALRAVVFVLAAILTATPAHALRVVAYNLLNYPGPSGPARDPYFRTILGPLGADLISAGEMQSQVGVNEFLGSVLNTLEPGQWTAAPFVDYTGDTENALFYKTSKFTYLGGWAFQPNAAQPLRVVNVYRMQPVGYTNTEFRVYNMHLKASDGSAERAQRLGEATGLRDSMNQVPPGTHAIAMGDMNFYRGSDELAYWKMLEPQADNDGRMVDVLNPLQIVQDWHDNPTYVPIHTQSPCLNSTGGPCASGAATGGMDDRFDFFLPTVNWGDGESFEVIPGTYIPVGNDALHWNLNITDAPVIPEGAAYATALKTAADHLPIRIDIEVPSMIAVAGGPLSFPTVIMGAPLPGLDVQVSNPATVPADELDYSFTGSTGFQVPAGSFEVDAGALAVSHQIRMGTGSFGNKVGTATIHSDAPDSPATVVDLSGTVLRHASPSLDGATVALTGSIDFGTQPAGGFTNQGIDVYNQAYDALQAQLSVDSGVISGGDDRFSIGDAFSPALVAATPASFSIHFDDTGAALDLDYDATLTFASTDEPLPGSTALPDLTVTLHARVSSGSVGTPIAGTPTITRLYAPTPNPLVRASALRFDLAAAAPARLDLFDLGGRRIATLADRRFEAGRYSLSWDGRDESGMAVEPGVYFARLSVRRLAAQTVRLAVVR